jgi:hypothetical protein
MPVSESAGVPRRQQSLVTPDLFALLEIYEAAQRALCAEIRASRSRMGDRDLVRPVDSLAPRAVFIRPRPPAVAGTRFDPVKVAGLHATKRSYNYFAELATYLARSTGNDTDLAHDAENNGASG